MAAFSQWLVGFVKTALIWLNNILITMLQAASDSFVDLIFAIISLLPSGSALPESSSIASSSSYTAMIQSLNWFFPVSYLVTLSTFLVTAMLGYVSFMIIGRWTKIYS